MSNNINIKLARQRIEENWKDIGMCQSCGYHGLVIEHNIDDYQIENALKTDGIIELRCLNDNDEDHRGIKFNLNDLEHQYDQ